MTGISATEFFRQAAAEPNFDHEEIDTGGTKRPTKIHLHAIDPGSGDRMGTLTYHVPRRKADKILIEHLGTEDAHRRKGVGSALMDEMQRRHPGTPIDHGDRTDAGKKWWAGYSDGKKVTRGRTMASASKPCPCCGGTGEHDTGFECYHCDGGLTVPADSPDDVTCDGNLPDGGHGKAAAADTPVPNNTEPYQHEHPWLPRDHLFEPTKPGLDPRLFDGDRMRPEVRQHLLSLLNGFWAPKYGDSWQSWARVYLAGSEASHFLNQDGTGNGDLDILIGVDYDVARAHVPALSGFSNEEISTSLTDELRAGLNDDSRMLPGPGGQETGPWENTWFVNQ